ncbi:MAG: GGDEF domain-containing protein [Gammaproteobacteria bacterium]
MQDPARKTGLSIRTLTLAYQRVLGAAFALSPLIAIAYLQAFQDPRLRFEHHGVHELAIGVAIALSSFATYVTWRCYLASGEVFLRWLTLGFLGFTLIYLPHGVLTRHVHEDLTLFLVFGPASRLVMAAYLFVALQRYGRPADPPESRQQHTFWLRGCVAFVLIMLAAAAVSLLPWPQARIILRTLEIGALSLSLAGILLMALWRIRSPLMTVYMISLAAFAQSSVSFLLSSAWNYQWWLAHGIFATGFFILSYGIMQAFHTTRSFSAVYSQAEMMEQLRSQQARTEEALLQVQKTNARLAELASTDSLTGVANRRHFMVRADMEVARSGRSGEALSLLCLDLDHFKQINDRHGHQVGDQVLKSVTAEIQRSLRPADLLARVGGEEFHVLLPDTALPQAVDVAERIRAAMEKLSIPLQDDTLQVTLSAGCAQLGVDAADLQSLIRIGDERLYEAKALGRNRVVAASRRAPAE